MRSWLLSCLGMGRGYLGRGWCFLVFLLMRFRRICGVRVSSVMMQRGACCIFHAFRKTFQTWGAQAGVGQRAAQELLGHSDPSLTANVYTDVSALGLHAEVAKLPEVMGGEVRTKGQTKSERSCEKTPFRAVLTQLIELAQKAISEMDNTVFSLPQLAARHGFEP